jgi:L,D-transpeptidase ErfK/SrfK
MDRLRAKYVAWALGMCVALGSVTARATVYELDGDAPQVFGEDVHIRTHYSDTLVDIARQYSLGYEEITRANPGVDPWLPGEGTEIVVPGRRILPNGPREGMLINLPEHRLYYFPKAKKGEKRVVVTYPVSIGKMDWKTPLGETHIVNKQKKPYWYPPASVRKEHNERGDPLPAVVPPGPDNPLGEFAMRLDIHPGTYLIHGTNNPLAVGMAVTHGCIRMYPEDIAAFFPTVPVGTKVWLVNEPVKLAYVDGELLLEVHPPIDAEGTTIEPNLDEFSQMLDRALGSNTAAIHWEFARQALLAARGMPVTVGLDAVPPQGDEPAPAAADSTPQPAAGEAGEPAAQAPAPQDHESAPHAAQQATPAKDEPTPAAAAQAAR